MKNVLSIICFVGCLTAAAGAGEIVNFIYNGANSLFSRTANVNVDGEMTWSFSDEVPLGGAASAEGNSSTDVYGGVSVTWESAGPASLFVRYAAIVTGDYAGGLQVRALSGDTYDRAVGIFAWPRSVFTGGDGRYLFTTNDQLSAVFAIQASLGECDIRFAVKTSSGWFVSEQTWDRTADSAQLVNPLSENWAPVNTSDYTIGSFFPLSLSDVRGVGLYFDVKGIDPEMPAAQIRVGNFRATAAKVVPSFTVSGDFGRNLTDENINYSGTGAAPAAGTFWNNLIFNAASVGVVFTNLLASDGVTETALYVETISGFQAARSSKTGNTLQQDRVYSTNDGSVAVMQFGGLDSSLEYDVYLYGSDFDTRFTIDGVSETVDGTVGDTVIWTEGAEYVLFPDTVPDSSGCITVSMQDVQEVFKGGIAGFQIVYTSSAGGDQPPEQISSGPVNVYGFTNQVSIELTDFFYDLEDESSTLVFALDSNSSTSLVETVQISLSQMDLMLVPGAAGDAQITVSVSDSASNTLVGTIGVHVERTGLKAWKHDRFGAAQVENPALENSLWGDAADPDGDGLANLVEYALMLNPSSIDSGLPGFSIDGNNLFFQRSEKLGQGGYGLHVLASKSLNKDSWFVLNEEDAVLDTSGGLQFCRKALTNEYESLYMKLAVRPQDEVTAWASGAMAPYNVRTNIFYKIAGGQWLQMLLVMPSVQVYERAPVMIYTHGGGWGSGDRFKMFNTTTAETLQILSSNGIACASIEYRLVQEGISTAYDCVVDCKDAARFLVKHADEFGIDPDRIGTWGGSAGGHLCLMTALAPDSEFPGDSNLTGIEPEFRCVASYFPATTFVDTNVLVGSNFESPSRFISFLGGPYDENMDLVELLSPAEHLTPTSPPVLLLHGTADTVLPYTNSVYMAGVAQNVGADVSLLTVTNGEHGLSGVDLSPTLSEVNRLAAEYIMEKLLAP